MGRITKNKSNVKAKEIETAKTFNQGVAFGLLISAMAAGIGIYLGHFFR